MDLGNNEFNEMEFVLLRTSNEIYDSIKLFTNLQELNLNFTDLGIGNRKFCEVINILNNFIAPIN